MEVLSNAVITLTDTVHSLTVNDESKSVALNAVELDIKTASLTQGDAVVASDLKHSYDEKKQILTFTFDKALSAGSKAKLTIGFVGYLNDKLAGFYRSSYPHPDGTTHYMATTQMEATDARRAFPCFDEPALKATFGVTLIADPSLTCLSNMDVASEKEVQSDITGGKRKAVTFNSTPLMSTYLLAFIIGELNYIETKEFRIPIRVYSPPNSNIEHGRFSLDLAAKTLKFYEEQFASPFPLPKMDMIAIPDFSAGAMENWGLVTYRSVDLLFDEKTSGANAKSRVAEVVQHELAHQWFGNLVTMDFWDGLWLNEGFATWMSWYSCNVFYPEWRIWESYVTDSLSNALSLDSLRSSHPIEVPVKRADEVNEIFDAISYLKGSSVLRMLSKYLGEDTFIEGIRRYLKKHAYGNTRTEDLWAALADASGKPVEEVMSIWTKNVGHPVVTVTEDPSTNSIHLKQNRFLKTGDVKPDEDKTLYPVFLELRTKDGVDNAATLTEREKTIKLKNLDFFKLNADQSGVYRTLYTPERLAKLGQASKEGLLSVEDRAGLIGDANAMTVSGYGKTSGVLSLVKSLDTETEFVVWSQILSSIGAIKGAWKFEDKAVQDALQAFQLKLVAPKAHEKGWAFSDSDSHIESQFKGMLFGSAGTAGDATIIAAAKDMFARFIAGDRKAIHPNIRGSVYALAIRHGGEAEFDALHKEYLTTADADERNTALRALGEVRGRSLIARSLQLPLSPEVKNQDIWLPLTGHRSCSENVAALWQWYQENYTKLTERAPPSMSMFGTLVKICTRQLTTRDHLKQVQAFHKDKDTTGFKMALEQSCDDIRASAGWVERDRDDVAQFLKSEGLLV